MSVVQLDLKFKKRAVQAAEQPLDGGCFVLRPFNSDGKFAERWREYSRRLRADLGANTIPESF